MKIAGKYKGYYEYGAGYELPYFGERVKIEVSIIGNKESFTGSVSEENNELSVPFDATIKGECEGDFIHFIKTYLVKPVISETDVNVMTIEEVQLDIIHNGVIDSKHNALYGEWTIVDKFIDDEGIGQEYYSSGIWYLTPIS